MGVSLSKPDKKKRRYVCVRHNGRRESFSVGEVDKRTGMKRVRQVRQQLALGVYKWKSDGDSVVAKYPVFQNFARDFLEMNKAILKNSTWCGYKNLINRYLLPEWTDFITKEIASQDVKQLLLKAQAGGLNINNLRICCSAIFQWGCDAGTLEKNVARGLGKAFRNGAVVKQTMQVLSKEEIKRFLEAIPKEWRCFVLLLFRSGLRLGEALGLGWKDVDSTINKICVQRAFTHNEWTSPKSGKIRYVDMTDMLAAALAERKKKVKQIPIRIGKEEVALVFADDKGQPINDRVVRREFKKALRKCKLPMSFRLHDCRHCFASHLLMSGLSVLYVKEQLGHASAKTTLDRYSHYIPTANAQDTNVLDE